MGEQLELVIVGAGPAGISMAVEAVHAGIPPEKVLVLEKGDAHSWGIRKFYPDSKAVTANYKGFDAVCHGVMCIADTTKDGMLSYIDDAIERNGIRVRYQALVHSIERVSEGFVLQVGDEQIAARVCVIAIGILGRPNKPDYAIPRAVKERVHFDVTSTPIENSEVLVVGGGDSASEYAQFLHEKGNRVSFSYRRNEFVRMNDINRQSLEALGERKEVRLLLGSNIEGLEEDGGRVRVRFAEEAVGARSYDHVVYALGGTTPENFLKTAGIEFIGGEPHVTEGFETNVPGLFLVGDLTAGKKGGSIISAFNSANQAMRKLCDGHLECRVG